MNINETQTINYVHTTKHFFRNFVPKIHYKMFVIIGFYSKKNVQQT